MVENFSYSASSRSSVFFFFCPLGPRVLVPASKYQVPSTEYIALAPFFAVSLAVFTPAICTRQTANLSPTFSLLFLFFFLFLLRHVLFPFFLPASSRSQHHTTSLQHRSSASFRVEFARAKSQQALAVVSSRGIVTRYVPSQKRAPQPPLRSFCFSKKDDNLLIPAGSPAPEPFPAPQELPVSILLRRQHPTQSSTAFTLFSSRFFPFHHHHLPQFLSSRPFCRAHSPPPAQRLSQQLRFRFVPRYLPVPLPQASVLRAARLPHFCVFGTLEGACRHATTFPC